MMTKKALKFFLFPVLAVLTLMVACKKTDSTTDTLAADDYVDQTLYSIQERGGLGKFGCYELVFPVSITMPDSTVQEFNSYEEIKDAFRTFFENNGGPQGNHHFGHGKRPIPQFVYPISVLNEDGEIITVANQDELIQLRKDCAGASFGNHGWQGHGQHGLACFEIVFPISVSFPDGTTAEAADRQALKELIRTWKQNNPNATERPQIVFPITVKMKDDGTLVTVNSRDDLRQLKKDCE